MGRRSTLVAFAALAVAAFVPASADAATAPNNVQATPTGVSAPPVTITWTTAPDVGSQQVYRAAGACGTIPAAVADTVTTPAAPLGGGPSVATDTPPADGTYCYYVQVDDIIPGTPAYSNGDQVVINTAPPPDTTPPTANPPGPAFTGAPNFVRGTVTVTLSSSDAGSPPTTNSLRLGIATCGAASAAIASPWDTTTVPGGAYVLCNVATDAVGNVGVSTAVPVVVDNIAPLAAVAAPGNGTVIGGTVALAVAASDANNIADVVWHWQGATGPVRTPPNGVQNSGNWPTNQGGNNQHAPDGATAIWAVVTDPAGNQTTTDQIHVIVDNTPPDGAPVVTAPPAVAGSPTLSWTPAHDAIGVARYDVLRGTSVIGTVGDIDGAQTYSFNDANAPDQATSSYRVRAYDATNHFIDSVSVAVLVDSKAQSAPHTLAAATPTAAAPVLTWQAPVTFNVDHYDVWRDGLLLASTVGPALTYTDTTAAEGVHDYAVLARSPNAQPGVLSSSFKVLLDLTPPTSGGAPTAQVLPTGPVQLAWPAADDALSGVAGYVVRRASGGIPPATADGGTAVCAPTTTDCADAATASGTWSYGVFARDTAGNVALIGTVAGVVINDTTAPLAPTKLSLSLVQTKAKKPSPNLTYTLRWVKPTAPDLDRVVVVLNLKRAPTQPADGKAIYKGLGTSTKVKLRAGQTAYLALFAYDHSGNVSLKPARKVIKLASLIPLRPLTGSVVRSSSPLLAWKAKKGTAYYNVQLFVNGKRVLVGWPSRAAYRIPAGKLQPGTYVWYVWPAIKHKGSTPTFGKLIGRATFTYKK